MGLCFLGLFLLFMLIRYHLWTIFWEVSYVCPSSSIFILPYPHKHFFLTNIEKSKFLQTTVYISVNIYTSTSIIKLNLSPLTSIKLVENSTSSVYISLLSTKLYHSFTWVFLWVDVLTYSFFSVSFWCTFFWDLV